MPRLPAARPRAPAPQLLPAPTPERPSQRQPRARRAPVCGAASSGAGGRDSPELVHPPGFVSRRLLVFVGILVSYTCL